MDYNHIIITRFNLDFEDDPQARCLQPEWLEKRFDLFETYCLPSVLQQTCQNFTWVILSSDATPAQYKKRLLSYQTSNIHIIFCPKYKDTEIHLLYQKIGYQYAQNYHFLVSTRLDNDDMLEAHYVEYVQNYINVHDLHNVILTFDSGVQWFLNKSMAYTVTHEVNHFTTFIEDKDHAATCLGINHVLVPKELLIHLQAQNMWCEIVHETNMLNNYTSAYHYSLRTPKGDYPVSLPKCNNYKKICFLLCKVVQFNFCRVCRFVKKIHRS